MTHPREICEELTYLYSQMTAFLMSSLIKQQYEQYKQLQSPSLGMKCPVVQIPAIVIRTHRHTHTHTPTHTLKCAPLEEGDPFTHTHTHTPTHTHTHTIVYLCKTETITHTHTHTPWSTHTPQKRLRTHTHTHTPQHI